MDLAPNGLPYSSCPPAHNEWCKFSPLLAHLPADKVRTTHPAIVARARHDVGGGMGLFLCNGIAKGEVVWAERKAAGLQVAPIARSHAWIEALPPASKKAYCHFMYKTGEDEYQSLAEFNETPIEDYPSVRTVDVSSYMNHSCSPTCWFVDGGDKYTGVMIAARDLVPGDEITYDYCTSEDCELSPSWDCHCQGPNCRGRITPQDWQLPELQARYATHFLPHIASKIAEAGSAAAASFPSFIESSYKTKVEHEAARLATLSPSATPGSPPMAAMQRVNSVDTWWVAVLAEKYTMPAVAAAAGRPDRQEMLRQLATGPQLDTINRQAAMLIMQHGLKVMHNDQVGGFVQTSCPISAGELVMLLPPNLLMWDDQVPDFNTCLQLGTTIDGDRLFSSSLTSDDVDNYLCHSCDPNCRFHIGPDMAAGLVATRDIAEGEAINFDYDETEDDLRGDRGGFECHCGAAKCRGEILGRFYSPKVEQRGSSCPR